MVMLLTLKRLFDLVAIAWILLWLSARVTMGGLMGDSIPLLSVFLGIALIPPSLLYFLLFRIARESQEDSRDPQHTYKVTPSWNHPGLAKPFNQRYR
jgi:hypothetical protein